MPRPSYGLLVPLLALTLGAGVLARAEPSLLQTPAALEPAPTVSFADWLSALGAEALERGIGERTVDRALSGLKPLPVIERDPTPIERALPLDEYLADRLTGNVVKLAREMAQQHAALVRRVSTTYRVPSAIIVAVWGLESNFGRFNGIRPTVATLATLAYDQHKSATLREELLAALTILDRGDIDVGQMRGTRLGAMGQPQFMPSSYLQFAEDFDDDGRRDIWNSQADVVASIANYLKAHGWAERGSWGRPVRVRPAVATRIAATVPLRSSGCEAFQQMTEARPLSEWRKVGVTASYGWPLPMSRMEASLVRAGARAFLTYKNYDALLAYNCAHWYALTVGLLADRIGMQ